MPPSPINIRSPWIKHGFWNTLEHGVTRGSDALTSLVLLWCLAPEVFSRLALAQAIAAPVLILFVSPELVIYRDFAKWRAEGISVLAARLRALRLFSWGKGQAALVLAAVIAWALRSQGSWNTEFCALIWAFSLMLAPQLSGADREFLRLDLRLELLNLLSLYQKLFLFGGTAAVAILTPSRLDYLAAVAVLSAVSTAYFAKRSVEKSLVAQGATLAELKGKMGPPVVDTLKSSLKTFSMWIHLAGVLFNWVQSMDLFFLGVFAYSAREIGLYAAVLKIANFSMALPMALANLFQVWVGRRVQIAGDRRELVELSRLSFWLFAGSVAQALLIYWAGPYLFGFLSHGRWPLPEQVKMLGWLGWIMGGSVLISCTFLLGSWLIVRTAASRLFFRVYLPWGLISMAVYSISVYLGGTQMVATANLIVGGVFLLLLWVYFYALAPMGDR